MKKLIELLQNEKLSQRTKRFLCAIYALPPVEKGTKEVDVTLFAELLGETKSTVISCCKELEDNGISFIEDNEAGEFYCFHVEINKCYSEVVVKLI